MISNCGKKVSVTQKQKDVIDALIESRKGGCATVHGYVPSTNWVDKPVQNINMITKFSISRLYERKIQALLSMTFEDVFSQTKDDEKLRQLTVEELEALFNERKQKEIDSMTKTLNGVRDDAHRQGHDRLYATFDNGVKINVVSQYNKETKQKEPVLNAKGQYSVGGILINYLALNVETVKEGVRKVVNSGCPVRMSKLIASQLNERSVGIKTLSLKEDNFDKLVISGKKITNDQVEYFGDILLG